jgi:hypothetical protein
MKTMKTTREKIDQLHDKLSRSIPTDCFDEPKFPSWLVNSKANDTDDEPKFPSWLVNSKANDK